MPNACGFVVGGGEHEVLGDQYFMYFGGVTFVSEHTLSGGQVPFLDGGICRPRKYVGIEYSCACNVALVAPSIQ